MPADGVVFATGIALAVATLVMGLCVAKRRSGEKGVDGDTQCHAEVRRSDPENEH